MYVDRLMRDWQVMHRAKAASLCSRATLMRRLREGVWWRPTRVTVALRTEFPDRDFAHLVGAAHCSPHGGVSGKSLPGLFGLQPHRAQVELSIPRPHNRPRADGYTLHRPCEVRLAPLRLPSGRDLMLDVGASSLAAAIDNLDLATTAWLLIRASNCIASGNDRELALTDFSSFAKRARQPRWPALTTLADAVIAGCESAGEVYVWVILSNLGVRFTCQRAYVIDQGLRQQSGGKMIRTDFVLEGDVIIEVDSALHTHIDDVRRDLWNLLDGRRTLRIVGTDVITDPVRAQQQLIGALDRLGVRTSATALPQWLQAA
jgi:hypothetical protein